MIIRQTLNFTAHLLAGAAVGALAVLTVQAMNRRQDMDSVADSWSGGSSFDGPEPSSDTPQGDVQS